MRRCIFFLSLITLLFSACMEVSPIIAGSGSGGSGPASPDNQLRQVLIEEFTGVGCVKCPAGSAVIKDLIGIHGEQLIRCRSTLLEIFCTKASKPVLILGPSRRGRPQQLFGWAAWFPRRLLTENLSEVASLQVGRNEWAGHIDEEKAIAPKSNWILKRNLMMPFRNASIDVTIFVEETITGQMSALASFLPRMILSTFRIRTTAQFSIMYDMYCGMATPLWRANL
ncbi:MAG: hypothetical protein R2788_22965 [Saprospiraceae bacterium]